MSMTKTLSLLTLALAIASPVAADNPTTGYKGLTGHWLMRACQHEDTLYSAYCAGYATGVLDTYGSTLCAPPNDIGSGVHSILVNWLKNNPHQLHRPARDLVFLAFYETFPCAAPKGANG